MAVPFLFCDLLLHNGAADFGGIHIRLAVALTNDSDHLALGHFLQVVHILKADLLVQWFRIAGIQQNGQHLGRFLRRSGTAASCRQTIPFPHQKPWQLSPVPPKRQRSPKFLL